MQASPQPAVRAWTEEVVIPTYLPAPPDKNPMFLEKRVYQGSSGKVYPLPFTDRITDTKVDRSWKVAWLENQYLRVMILPELGGRIHRILDKTNGYDLIYYQPVIKPALVGLAGPWISGGIEFNWPQHHRPATFLPLDMEIEEHPDGSRTVWCSDHDPMARMKGMHGVCLWPGQAVVELKVRVYNRTPFVQTFLWWANVATRVHEGYQSFFPPDVHYVADHAKRAISSYPHCQGSYYGVDYADRAANGVPLGEPMPKYVPSNRGAKARKPWAAYAANDLSWYANIVTPCSYMAIGSSEDFFGGYDHIAEAGIVHVADHHIAPGKKQWTWGNHSFGYAWDRNLTDATPGGEHPPYIELMAGVFTDNQPDFSFLAPAETKTWNQYWYPIQKTGPVQQANVDAAVSLKLEEKRYRIAVSVTREFPQALIRLEGRDRSTEWKADLAPGKPFVRETRQPERPWVVEETTLRVLSQSGAEIISRKPVVPLDNATPRPANEPPSASRIPSNDELYLTGLHLGQYRHATRCPTVYWREALRRDPWDSRCNNALGLWHLKRGEYDLAASHFRKAISRLTTRNPNPRDSEAYYNLGLALRHRSGGALDLVEAYDAFYKSTWDRAWRAPGFLAVAEIDCLRRDWPKALQHLKDCLEIAPQCLNARNLKAMVLRRLARDEEAKALVRDSLALDRLDWWARYLAHQHMTCDSQTILDLTHNLARAGFIEEAVVLLEGHLSEFRAMQNGLPDQSLGSLPMLHYTLGWLNEKIGDAFGAKGFYEKGAAAAPDYCFPSRLEDISLLEAAMRGNPADARAPYYLGNLLYDKRRHREAIRLWERSTRLDPGFATAWRNLGIGYFNITGQPRRARAAYERALRCNPNDGRVVYERDQLWKRLGVAPAIRLAELEKHVEVVHGRDDLTVELCALCNQVGQHERALELLQTRVFQPWEGGEGLVLAQHVRTHVALGRTLLARGDAHAARSHFEAALASPENLGEAAHILANQSDVHYWLGVALERAGENTPARDHWAKAGHFKGDFQEMSVRACSEMTYYSALALQRLGHSTQAEDLLRELLDYARKLARARATIDYFATSLPAMLLFDDDIDARQRTKAMYLEAQARLGLGEIAPAERLLRSVLKRDPNHSLTADFMRQISRAPGDHPM